jgi:hypothetical protein
MRYGKQRAHRLQGKALVCYLESHGRSYLLHESVRWNALLRRWFFLPRRVSTEAYDEALDEERGGNLVVSLDEYFSDIRTSTIGVHIPLPRVGLMPLFSPKSPPTDSPHFSSCPSERQKW